MLFECAYIFKHWKNYLHTCLFFNAAAIFVNNAGYLAIMLAENENAALLARQLSYLGRVWIPYTLLIFLLRLCKVSCSKRFLAVLSGIHGLTYLMVLTSQWQPLYYQNIGFSEEGLFPHLTFSAGPWYFGYAVLISTYMIVGMKILIKAIAREHRKVVRQQMNVFFRVIITLCIFYLMDLIQVYRKEVYDMTTIGYTISTAIMYVAMFRNNILDSLEFARDYISDKISEAIIVTDNMGYVEYFNFPAEQLFPKLVTDPAEVVSMLQNHIAIPGERPLPMNQNGRVYTPEADTIIRGGEVYGTVYVLVDDTEHFRYMEDLKEQRKIAESANKAKGEFLTSMSHEIRTPINAVLGLDEMILRESDDETIRNYAGDIRSAGKTLLALINDVLDFSKIEAGKMEIIPANYDLSDTISDLKNMISSRADAKGLSLLVNVAPDIPYKLKGDENRIKQCVLNILTNAVKYTQKGSVTLDVSAEKTGDNTIALRFTVSDTGIGIKEADLEKLYTPFQRIEEKRNRSIEGTGLGMSIVHNLLSLMGSSLDIQSKYGKGSRFSFAVEQKVRDWKEIGNWLERHKNTIASAHYEEGFQAPDAKILIVDDNPMNLTVAKGLLKQTRIQIDTAASGSIAILMAQKTKYDIIYLDHLMPEMDGIETLNKIKSDADNKNSKTPSVALTANAVAGAREMYLGKGFDGYLCKPVNGEAFEQSILEFLPKELVLHKGDTGYVLKSAAGEKKPENSTSSEIATFLEELFGIDINASMKNCGSLEIFKDVVSQFCENIEPKSAQIETYCSERNWHDYTIQVHALKSSSRLVGALELSTLAEELEALGNKIQTSTGEDAEHLESELVTKTKKLLSDYRSYKQKFAFLCSKNASRDNSSDTDDDKQLLSNERAEEAFSALKEVLSMFDFDSAESIIADVETYRLLEPYASKLRQIKACVRSVDADSALAFL